MLQFRDFLLATGLALSWLNFGVLAMGHKTNQSATQQSEANSTAVNVYHVRDYTSNPDRSNLPRDFDETVQRKTVIGDTLDGDSHPRVGYTENISMENIYKLLDQVTDDDNRHHLETVFRKPKTQRSLRRLLKDRTFKIFINSLKYEKLDNSVSELDDMLASQAFVDFYMTLPTDDKTSLALNKLIDFLPYDKIGVGNHDIVDQ